MEYSFNSDEFTLRDLIAYVKRAYGHQVNGNSFAQRNVERWLQEGKLPDAYGGNKILKIETYPQLNDLRIITIDQLNREWIEDIYGSLDKLNSTLQKEKAKLNKKRTRTKLYYQTLGSRSNGKKLAAAAAGNELPGNWMEAGIKGNQVNKHKKK